MGVSVQGASDATRRNDLSRSRQRVSAPHGARRARFFQTPMSTMSMAACVSSPATLILERSQKPNSFAQPPVRLLDVLKLTPLAALA